MEKLGQSEATAVSTSTPADMSTFLFIVFDTFTSTDGMPIPGTICLKFGRHFAQTKRTQLLRIEYASKLPHQTCKKKNMDCFSNTSRGGRFIFSIPHVELFYFDPPDRGGGGPETVPSPNRYAKLCKRNTGDGGEPLPPCSIKRNTGDGQEPSPPSIYEG